MHEISKHIGHGEIHGHAQGIADDLKFTIPISLGSNLASFGKLHVDAVTRGPWSGQHDTHRLMHRIHLRRRRRHNIFGKGGIGNAEHAHFEIANMPLYARHPFNGRFHFFFLEEGPAHWFPHDDEFDVGKALSVSVARSLGSDGNGSDDILVKLVHGETYLRMNVNVHPALQSESVTALAAIVFGDVVRYAGEKGFAALVVEIATLGHVPGRCLEALFGAVSQCPRLILQMHLAAFPSLMQQPYTLYPAALMLRCEYPDDNTVPNNRVVLEGDDARLVVYGRRNAAVEDYFAGTPLTMVFQGEQTFDAIYRDVVTDWQRYGFALLMTGSPLLRRGAGDRVERRIAGMLWSVPPAEQHIVGRGPSSL